MNNKDRASFMSKGWVVFLGAMLSCALWGSAFPFVKTGMKMLGLSSSDTAGQILFGGVRFVLAGILVLIAGSAVRRRPLVPRRDQIPRIMLLSIFQCSGQYIFYYIGIARATGVNTAIVDSLSFFLSIIFACLIFRMEKMTAVKILGCVLGFSGVVIVCLEGASLSLQMSAAGEGMIVVSAACSAMSTSVSKIFSRDDDVMLLCGSQFIFGGLVMIAAAFALGAEPLHFAPSSAALLIYLAFVSSCAYSVWVLLLKYNPVSLVAIYGFMTPVFGVILSALILGESQGLQLRYIISLAVISLGIMLVNRAPSESPGDR